MFNRKPVLFDLGIYADRMSVEAYVPLSKSGKPALHISFDGSDTPLGITLDEMTADMAKAIAEAVNAILDGHTVTIHRENEESA